MYEAVNQALQSGNFTVLESFTLPPRLARYVPVPGFLHETGVGAHLQQAYGNGLWQHQAAALELLGDWRNVVVPTGTASGKSLIFRSLAFHRVLSEQANRVLVFYPLKALAGDQLRGWQSMARALGIPSEMIGRIDGSVPTHRRDAILQTARIVIMTPDVCHAWLMSRLAIPAVKQFLRDLAVVVLDEAHTLEGVFGSNFAFLMRRLLAARTFVQKQTNTKLEIQFVAATATIRNPSEHLSALTGLNFEIVADALDGSPRATRLCVHIAAPPGQELEIAREMHRALLREGRDSGFITFVDSRKGVELLARDNKKAIEDLLTSADVLPYRAGYMAEDREKIERRLQNGTLRGVVSTSALELGIDLPYLAVGLNVGVPATRKSYRQRLGRAGRASDGAFLIIAPPDAFSAFGMSFQEYHDMSVEDSYLYLDNRFMQFAHARCLVDELEGIGAGTSLPTALSWPVGFDEVFGWAKPGGNRPPQFDAIAQFGGDSPQHGYPLRNVGEISFRIGQGDSAGQLGEANESQALRECYPGATYWHLGRPWEVSAWHTNNFSGPLIKVKPGSPGRLTRPRIRTWINAGIAAQDLMEGHFLQGENGFLAECLMQVTEKVEGYEDANTNTYRPYSELRQQNPNLKPRIRNFRTSGVLLCVQEPWFRASDLKQHFADRLIAVFSREYSVLPQDVGSSATNISVRTAEGGGPRADCIVVFDQTYGSLRLTEQLFFHFDQALDRLERAADAEGEAGKVFGDAVRAVQKSVRTFTNVGEPKKSPEGVVLGKYIRVYTPSSRVSYREKGKMGSEVQIIRPTLMDGRLMYQVECPPRHPGSMPVKQWIVSEFVEPTAGEGEWDMAWWNSENEEFEEPPDGSEGN